MESITSEFLQQISVVGNPGVVSLGNLNFIAPKPKKWLDGEDGNDEDDNVGDDTDVEDDDEKEEDSDDDSEAVDEDASWE